MREEKGNRAGGSAPARPVARATVRRIRSSDGAELRRVRLAALSGDPDAFGSTYAGEAAKPDAQWRNRAHTGATSATDAVWVAEAPDGHLVGMAGLHAEGTELHLQGVWLDPRWRGRGIGRGLVEAAITWLDMQRPETPLHLCVNPQLTAAVALYRSLGFVETGETGPLRPGSDLMRISMVRSPR